MTVWDAVLLTAVVFVLRATTPKAEYNLDVALLSPLGFRLVHGQLSARLFCWLAVHAPRLAWVWAWRGTKGNR